MKGDILDFLKFTAEKPELAKELVDVAARHGFELADDELGEMKALRLQMTMDRRSKHISILSQIMKTLSSTQDFLVQNMK